MMVSTFEMNEQLWQPSRIERFLKNWQKKTDWKYINVLFMEKSSKKTLTNFSVFVNLLQNQNFLQSLYKIK